MLVVATLYLKGGSGKTTMSVNLAAAAHFDGLSTLIIDADTQGSAFAWSIKRREGSTLDGLAVARADKPLRAARFAELARGRDVVVIDGPARQRDVTESSAFLADVVLVPICPGPYDFWSVDDTLEVLNRADELREDAGRPPARRLFVLNRASSRTRLSRTAEVELSTQNGGTFAGVVRNRVAFGERALVGESVFGLASAKEAADEITSLWKAVKGEKRLNGKRTKGRAAETTHQEA